MKRMVLLVCLLQVVLVSSAQQYVSPYKLSAGLDIPLSTNALGLLGTGYLLGTTQVMPSKQSLTSLNRKSINALDRYATYQNSKIAGYASDATLYACFAIPLLHLISKNSRKDFGKIATMSGEVIALNLAITDIFKETVRRKRPLLYNPDVSIDTKYTKDNFKSFFSGHTSTVASMSFFFAKTFADYNPHSKLKPMVWALCASLPVATGVLRVQAGKHYWTDVITGYAVGALVGIAVPYLHTIKIKDR